ncbi:MAG: DUF433 domain-containing protein [Chloroflexota bacterium]|nr:DUF433 domain-containing protein [Chloroflexota bacterium]
MEQTISATALINRDPEIMGGTPVFMGTRVPIQNLLDYIQHGPTVDEFLDEFPTVEREQVLQLITLMRHLLLEDNQ